MWPCRIVPPSPLRASLLTALAMAALLLWAAPSLAAPAAAGSAVQHHRHHKKKKHRHRPRPFYWGAWIGDQLTGRAAPWDMGAASRFEEIVGRRMSLLEFSSPFADCSSSPCSFYSFPGDAMEAVRQHGSIPFFSWGSEASPREGPTQEDYQLSDLIEGRYDSYIRGFASEAAAWGHPFFLRFDWEMNGSWFPWSEPVNGNAPGQFIAAWRHVHDIFSSVGATNVTWVWCPFADPNGRFQEMRQIYPGSRYVDWTCLDVYNWGTNAVNPQPWRSFDKLIGSSYQQLVHKVAPRKPMVLAEFASSSSGGHKALWIRRMFGSLLTKYPKVRGLIWFDTPDRGIDWPIEASTTATRSFSAGIDHWYFLENQFAQLAESPIYPIG